MRNTAWILTITLWLFSAVSYSETLASFGKEAAIPDPPACPAKFDDSLATNGIANGMAGDFQHDLIPPIPKTTPEASFSDKARREFKLNHLKSSVSILSMVVGVDGAPRDVCLVRSAGYDLDGSAAQAVGKYRFIPATKHGKKVPARVSIEVNFRIQ